MKRKHLPGVEEGGSERQVRRLCRRQDDLKLTELPRELMASVLSFIHFYERSVVRRVCRRLLGAVDSMPALSGSALFVKTTAIDPEQRENPSVHMFYDKDESTVFLEVCLEMQDIQQVLPLIPPLGSIRPSQLYVTSESPAGVDARLIQHVAVDVGSTVTSLSIDGLRSGSLVGLQNAFSAFQKDKVTDLELGGCFCPFAHAVSAASCLRGLVRLDATLTDEMVSDWESQPDQIGLHLSALATLPHLRDISLKTGAHGYVAGMPTNSGVVCSMALGLSAISQLRRLSTNLLYGWCNESGEAIAMMLSRLKNLEEIGKISFCGEEVWRPLSLRGGNKQLRKTEVIYQWGDSERLEGLVSAMEHSFPALMELTIHFVDIHHPDEERSSFLEQVPKLTGLAAHPSLSTVKFSFTSQVPEAERKAFLERFRAEVSGINVVEEILQVEQ